MDIEGNLAVWAAFMVAIATAVVASVFDFRRFCVPNMVTVPLCIMGLTLHTFAGQGFMYSAAGMAVGLGVLLPFFMTGAMGGGDVKLLAAVGAWIGPINTVYVFCVAGVIAGVYTVVVLVLQGRAQQIPTILRITFLQLMTLGRHLASSESVASVAERPDRRWYVMPFAVMIAIGVIAVAASAAAFDLRTAGTVLLAIGCVAAMARGVG